MAMLHILFVVFTEGRVSLVCGTFKQRQSETSTYLYGQTRSKEVSVI